ncbi:vegetative incompatibility protein HET-E-1 [Diaporthe sp. PMI_573]|nr:vegetative incompatibility protein HET-E-1 [Diaporthaceae sp. PMI_573]
MRLLHRSDTGAIRLTEDIVKNIPRYAILSHRWGAEEVTLQELSDGTGQSKRGYHKIRFCGEQARRDGLSYFWVDTCCIDKKNAVELQEAINSMFRWYRNAARCYVYLDDVSYPTAQSEPPGAPPQKKQKRLDTAASAVQPTEPEWQSAFRNSLWFTRGWTLQELLAPASVEFFSREGTLLGNKISLEQSIRDVTRIPAEALRNSQLPDFSVSDRYSWMDHRETTREEDMAYALLGIFDVQMPLIYGEGRARAFGRLRKEVDQTTTPPPIPVAEGATFDSRAEEHNTQCYPDTRVNLLRQITSWAEDPSGKVIFWLNGMAGTGKSTVSRTVAQRFHERGLLGSSFFFKRGEADRGHAARLFTTLAAELAKKVPRVARQIRTAIDADPDLGSKALREQFEKLILRALTDMRNPQTLIIVIDALDECDGDTDIKAIIHLLSQARTLPSVRLRTFLTSRPELPIRLGFKKIHGGYQDLVLHEIPRPIIAHDLRVFFEFELARIREEYNTGAFEDLELPPDWPGQHIETLVGLAVPLFIFAATICRFLEDTAWRNPAGQLQKLLAYQAASRNSELDKLSRTYLPVLDQLVEGKSDLQKERLLEGFRNIVGAIVLLAEPLSASALSRLLDIPLGIIQCQLQTLHSVLAIPPRADAPIRAFHLSFHDFLVDPLKKDTNKFWINEQVTHERLAARCIELLSTNETLKKNICSLREPGVSLSQVDRQTIDTCLPPAVQYACLYWANHLERGKVSIQDKGQVHAFLQTHFLHWLEALCLMGKMYDSISVVEVLRKRCQPGTHIDKLLRDANRFILNCIPIVTKHPLQLYSSAICFSPEKSVIRQKVQREMSTWIVRAPAMEDTWNACVQTLEGHDGRIRSIAISPDGRWLASGSDDKTVKIWDVATGACKQTLVGHDDWIQSIAISPDGRWLASGSDDKTVKIWDVATGACKQTLVGHDDGIQSIAISPDGRWLASGSDDKTVKIWDVATGACKQTLVGRDDGILSIAISPDGRWLASGSDDKTVKIWDMATGACKQTLVGHADGIQSIAISPDGRWLASGSDDKTVKIWDMATGACKQTLVGHADGIQSIAISPDGRWLASGSWDKTVKIWDMATGACKQTLVGHDDWILSIAISPDGRWLASGSDDKTIKIWDMATGACKQTLVGHDDRIRSIAISPDGRWLASGSDDKTVKIWDMATGACKQTLVGRDDRILSIAISPDGRWLASGSDKTIKIWDMATGACKQTLHMDKIICRLAFDSNIRLHTEIGIINLDTHISRTSEVVQPATVDSEPHYQGYGIHASWIMWNDQRVMWLPPEYRPRQSAIVGTTIVLGCVSGRVLVLKCSTDNPVA